ncbi:MAG: glycosyltransferase [Phycisphaerales bacterium]|nr:glycosyltransferase [Phycisphaerales bacterium]
MEATDPSGGQAVMTVESGCDVLYVITDLEVGGVPLHLLRLACAMRDRGRSVRVVSLARPGPVGGQLAAAGITVGSCRAAGGWDARVFPRLTRFIREIRPRVIHAMLFHANFAARIAARLAGFPADRVLCEIQTVEIERRWHLLVDRWTNGGCRFTIGNSPSVIAHLAEHARIPADRLRLIRGGIDVERVDAVTPADRGVMGLHAEDRVILWAGRLDPIKGVDVLLCAMALLRETEPRAVLLLAGDGPMRTELQRQAIALNLGESARFLGMRTDVAALMKCCDVFAFPSRTEGLPNALLEAMACRCAIVTTDAPGCHDLIEPERTGLRVAPNDEASLASALARLLSDRPLASALAREARLAVTTSWHFARMLDDYAAAYVEADAATGAGSR